MEHPKDVGDGSTLAIIMETAGVYMIPIGDLPLRAAAHLRIDPPRNNQRKRIRFAADYEIARVTTEGLRASSGA
ncbi:MAG: hypothetical protein M3O89_03570 [Actinomycetota bacterium]|nr:hypothetical protein [Actinomycetota bacterium]